MTSCSAVCATVFSVAAYGQSTFGTVLGTVKDPSGSLVPRAFVDPADNVGRFGDFQQGAVVGPGTKAVSLSLLKRIFVKESGRFEIGAQVANLFNHPNYAAPSNLTVGVAGFGQINALQTAEGAGPRAIQLTGRFTFLVGK